MLVTTENDLNNAIHRACDIGVCTERYGILTRDIFLPDENKLCVMKIMTVVAYALGLQRLLTCAINELANQRFHYRKERDEHNMLKDYHKLTIKGKDDHIKRLETELNEVKAKRLEERKND